ncbi:MAG: SDR family NAD(P)-dependent oxidoreductase [Actinomycetota bacterium]|jgi:3-oxoacyl-[acyl-carrier protein] reductase|nr:SDR family NAD(P)-dependent oxidoreductase [Actinomycetota bacterium]
MAKSFSGRGGQMMSPLLSLFGTSAIVTGAGSGLGQVMATALAEAGASVLLVDQNKAALDAVASALGENVAAAQADVTLTADMDGVVDLCRDRFGHVDVVVCNAGIGMSSIRSDYHTNPINFWELDPEVVRRFLDVNTLGAFRLARAAVPRMQEQGWGRIVSVTTSLSTMIRKGNCPYGPSKAAHEALAAIMAEDLQGSGVAVNVLVPGGAADTPLVPGPARSALINPSVMGPPVVWLASRESDGISGRRFTANKWDSSLPTGEAARLCSAPIAWSTEHQQ